jgi:hypothetical protein
MENTPYIDSAILNLKTAYTAVMRILAITILRFCEFCRIEEKTAYTAVERRDQGGMRGFPAMKEKQCIPP